MKLEPYKQKSFTNPKSAGARGACSTMYCKGKPVKQYKDARNFPRTCCAECAERVKGKS